MKRTVTGVTNKIQEIISLDSDDDEMEGDDDCVSALNKAWFKEVDSNKPNLNWSIKDLIAFVNKPPKDASSPGPPKTHHHPALINIFGSRDIFDINGINLREPILPQMAAQFTWSIL